MCKAEQSRSSDTPIRYTCKLTKDLVHSVDQQRNSSNVALAIHVLCSMTTYVPNEVQGMMHAATPYPSYLAIPDQSALALPCAFVLSADYQIWIA